MTETENDPDNLEATPDEAAAADDAAVEAVAEPAVDEGEAAKPAADEAEEAKPKRRVRSRAKAAKAGADASADAEPADEADAKPKRARRTREPAAAKAEPVAEAADADAEEKPKARRTRRTRSQGKAQPEKPAARKKRPAHDWGDNPPMVRAHAKYVRTSARKARLVCDHIRGKSVEEARAILAHANRDVARDWSKLLESAVANAEHNHELLGDELRIAAVKADEGPTLKRFRPRAMGRATKIRKRTSHLSITLTPMDRER